MEKILVVDDAARGLHNVASFLRLEDYEVDEACDENQAVLFLDQVKFDLVLSDVMMPGLNGAWSFRNIFDQLPLISPFCSCQDFPILNLTKSSPGGGGFYYQAARPRCVVIQGQASP